MSCRTYAELQAETWWGREIRTDELKWLGDELCRRTGAAADSIGTKGNNCHLNGGHRSQEWIQHSAYCTNHSYTVQSGLTAEQLRHLAALDRTPGVWGTAANRAQMAVETRRLLDAAKAGLLDGVTQVEGTLDGKTPFGYNVLSGTTFTPDSSHLDHWHLTFDRRRLRDMALMQKIADAAVGPAQGGDEMYCKYGDGNKPQAPSRNVKTLQNKLLLLDPACLPGFGADGGYGDETTAAFVAQVPGVGDGKNYDEVTIPLMDKEFARRFGTGGGVPGGEVILHVPAQDLAINLPEQAVTAGVVVVVPTK